METVRIIQFTFFVDKRQNLLPVSRRHIRFLLKSGLAVSLFLCGLQYWRLQDQDEDLPSSGIQIPVLSNFTNQIERNYISNKNNVVKNARNNFPSGPSRIPVISEPKIQYWYLEPEAFAKAQKEEQACPIPKLEPWSPEVKSYFQNHKLDFHGCENNEFPLLFDSFNNPHGEIVPIKSKEDFESLGIRSCCYKTILRGNGSRFPPDDHYTFSKFCLQLSLQRPTKIPPDHEFIAIFCQTSAGTEKVVDMHIFVGNQGRKLRRRRSLSSEQKKNKLNVLILGLDSMSRMNLIRTMPRTYEYLTEDFGALEFQGYNKVRENTFPNLLSLLSGLLPEEAERSCARPNDTLDSCPWLWKDYRAEGYLTSFGEDASFMATFNSRRRGFKRQPTDYYLRPFTVAANENIASGRNGFCYGPRLSFQVWMEYMRKFVKRMALERRPYFHFLWNNYPAHDSVLGARLADEPMLASLKWLKGSGHLENTVVVVLSDHGQRMDSFRNTLQGQAEDMLPYLFLRLPDWMRKDSGEFSRAWRNLEGNRERLTTPLDLHETLKDILDFRRRLSNSEVEERERGLKVLEKKLKLPRGISLFLPVPRSRTCEQARIPKEFCSCRNLKLVDPAGKEGRLIAEQLVQVINDLVLKKVEGKCAKLELSHVQILQRSGREDVVREAEPELDFGPEIEDRLKKRVEELLVNFEVKPSGAIFEALVSRKWNGMWNGWSRWEVGERIFRVSEFGNQSSCLSHDMIREDFCYCV